MKRVFILLLPIMVLSTACKELDELTKFNMDYSQTITIPASTGINLPLNLFTPEVESDSESTFSSNNTNRDLIEEIRLTEMTLTITSPQNGDFGFLQSIEMFISAEDETEQRIAWIENVPVNAGNTLALETSDDDLQEYIKQDNFVLRINTVTDEALGSDHEIEIVSTFFVDAKILGI